MNGNARWVVGLAVFFTLILSFSAPSQADNDFSATTNALQQQGFIKQDTGETVDQGQMPLNTFREADRLNSGNILGRLKLSDSDSPLPRDRVFFNYDYFGASPPDTRSMGFEKDSDHYIPITNLRRID